MNDVTNFVFCVDDTDDLSKKTSTGAVAERIAQEALQLGGSIQLGITRHQLLLDPRVPYTSHNSAMAFAGSLPMGRVEAFLQEAEAITCSMMAETANPGLCFAVIPEADDPLLTEVLSFGWRAKREFITVAEAFELASRVPWVRLTQIDGTGDGVVGALAGVGLRLSGSNGRFRGRLDLESLVLGKSTSQGGGKGKGNGQGKGQGRKQNKDSSPATEQLKTAPSKRCSAP